MSQATPHLSPESSADRDHKQADPLRRADPSARRLSVVRTWLVVFFFALPAIGGVLAFLQILRDDVGGVEGLGQPVGVAVSPEGRHVYAIGQGDNALVAFVRDATHDTLSFTQALTDEVDGVFGLEGASAVTVSPDGRHVYATSAIDDSLVVFSRSATIDTLSFTAVVKQNGVGGVFGLEGAAAVKVSGDGRHVFVTGKTDGALAVFSRDATLDELVMVDLEGFGGADLGGAASIAVSADDRHVYVTGETDDTLLVFTRDPLADDLDSLTLTAQYDDGLGGIDGLDGASSVVVSPDDKHVYATGRDDDAIAMFERDQTTGELSYLGSLSDGLAGVDGLDGAASVAIEPNGRLLFVAGRAENALAVFSRDRQTGQLQFEEVLKDSDALDGLGGAAFLAISPDARHLYVAGIDDDSVTGFGIFWLIFGDDFESGNTNAWSSTGP
ncbi:MAG: lactonase family protein [bacterium]|nr:lactonase family protein [bacterium]